MAEPIEMQFGMLTGCVQGTCIRWRCKCPYGKGHFWGVWPIEKHCKAGP